MVEFFHGAGANGWEEVDDPSNMAGNLGHLSTYMRSEQIRARNKNERKK